MSDGVKKKHYMDIHFDFTSDTPGYWDNFWGPNGEIAYKCKDPDTYSPTLREYHRILWSKPLPNGEHMNLEKGKAGEYLRWKDMCFGSDSLILSYRYNKDLMKQWRELDNDFKVHMEELFRVSYTIGGMLIFPKHRSSLNQMRGINSIIRDRFDLTLECIRRYYKDENSPLFKYLVKDKNFFDLFIDFKGYVDFFLLNDCVSEDYRQVDCWLGDLSMENNGIPKDIEEYKHFMKNQLLFLNKRNSRIETYIRNEEIVYLR